MVFWAVLVEKNKPNSKHALSPFDYAQDKLRRMGRSLLAPRPSLGVMQKYFIFFFTRWLIVLYYYYTIVIAQ
jgi:hypothetical protein